jgi:hypothetical protein
LANVLSWVGVLVGAAALIVAYFTYRSQRGKTRLEFVVVSNARVVPATISTKLEVTYNDSAVPDASVAIIRLVNTGDKAIVAEDFSTDLIVRLDGAEEVVSASSTQTRPVDLDPELNVRGNRVLITPLLINPGDMMELQMLASGLASLITIEGRIANVGEIPQRSLPYPPGSGPEGEMLGFDKFFWFVLPIGIFISAIFLILEAKMAPFAKASSILGSLLLFSLYTQCRSRI